MLQAARPYHAYFDAFEPGVRPLSGLASRAGRSVNILAASPFSMDGKLRHVAPEPGDYAMVLENQPASRQRAKVKVRVWLESAISPREVSPQRRLAVILISTIVFFGIVSFSAVKLRDEAR